MFFFFFFFFVKDDAFFLFAVMWSSEAWRLGCERSKSLSFVDLVSRLLYFFMLNLAEHEINQVSDF